MLVKEYRIPLPLTVEEYRVAQLYMIAKKSREETKGAGSGVQILVNEPYVDGPGGNGQYTHKIYHIGSHLPGWFKALLPKSALTVEEEAWNAYPYTKTRYTCPFVEKFFLEIETKYFGDMGTQENVFDLNGTDLRNRCVDEIDVVRDQLYGSDYRKEEDPRYFVSQVTGRGPLQENWLDELPEEGAVMCAYKLCRVEFKYWGMQSKIEKFIHDIALRKTMLRAHRQAWAWQDEWVGLTMEDIRRLEKETQEALAKKMSGEGSSSSSLGQDGQEHSSGGSQKQLHTSVSGQEVDLAAIDKDKDPGTATTTLRGAPKSRSPSPHLVKVGGLALHFEDVARSREDVTVGDGRRKLWSRSSSKTALHSPSGSSTKSFEIQLANWRMESIVRDSESTSDEDEEEFFDAEDDQNFSPVTKWSSLEGLNSEQGTPEGEEAVFRKGARGDSPTHHQPCCTSVLLMVLHGGSVLDSGAESLPGKTSDVTTFRGSLEGVLRQHYPAVSGRIAVRLVACPPVCAEALTILSSLSPYSFQASPSTIDGVCNTNDAIPLGALPLFAVSSPEYHENVSKVIAAANHTYHEFLRSEDGYGFCGQVVLIGDSVGSLLSYDALCRTGQYSSRYGSENSISELDPCASSSLPPRANPLISISDGSGNEDGGQEEGFPSSRQQQQPANKPSARVYRKSHSHPQDPDVAFFDAASYNRLLSAPAPRRRSSCSSDQSGHHKFDFEVSDFFVCGSSLGTVLAYRKVLAFDEKNASPARPFCGQVYNLFHPTDPCTSRIEPLLHPRFSLLPPVNIPRYQKFPLGDGEPTHLLEYLQSHAHVFVEGAAALPCNRETMGRRTSEASITSTVSGLVESVPLATVSALTHKWWGSKRLDYALYCPEGLANFPANALPHLFHASFWESTDVVAFVLRQLTRSSSSEGPSLPGDKEIPLFIPCQPREKWQRKRTSVKLKNVTANHRANDVIVKDGAPQLIQARFVYGPLDMVALSGEKVDVHVMRDPRTGEWNLLTTEVTDKNGRITYTIPKEKALGYGMFPVKMVVRGDHTAIDFFMAVIPPKTECVVFSIDGSFTASVSVTGRDPKVRAGAVDVVRHWQELGYLIVYVTGRPDMQQQRVVSWLAQHNFPHGLVSFAEGFSTDPLRHKAEYLKSLMSNADIVIHAAYGSSKDIWVYSSLGVPPERIFIVGKASKKQHSVASVGSFRFRKGITRTPTSLPVLLQVLSEGYAAHLSDLKTPGGSRAARGNARMIIPRGCFGLPGGGTVRQRRSAKRTTSYPLSGDGRGLSPKPPV